MINKTFPVNNQKILLIEDDLDTSGLVSTMLQKGGYTVVVANSGKAGVELAHEQLPDLIVCDIMMPEMDGLSVLRTLRIQSDTATIPFIFLTARARVENMREGMELGADDYLTKPIQMNVLLGAVTTRIQRHQQLQAGRLASFAQRLVLSQEHQRQQLSSILDNEVSQSLRSLQFIFNMVGTPSTQDSSLYNGARDLLENLIRQVESLVQEMHPSMLERLGLVPTIRWLAEQHHLKIELEIDNMEYSFDPQTLMCVFRLVQESLDNITRHAKTDHAKITLKYTAPYLEVRVEDDGVGFDLEQVLQSNRSMGLQHMYGLVVWLNGELHITSRQNTGTVVYALLPQASVDPIIRSSISGDFLRRLTDRPQQVENMAKSSSSVRILLAMQQPLQLQGMRRLLMSNSQFQVLDEIQDMDQIIPALDKYRPQLLILNPIAEGKSQKEILQSIALTHPETPILVISTATHEEYILDAMESGALGYIPNTATLTDLHTAIVQVSKKQHYLSPALIFDLTRWMQLRSDQISSVV
jgi:two-component system, sensor histidine kinase and response regulator